MKKLTGFSVMELLHLSLPYLKKNLSLRQKKKILFQIRKLYRNLQIFLKAFHIPMNTSETILQSVQPFLQKEKSHNTRLKFFQSL